jgi:hypothetical protein
MHTEDYIKKIQDLPEPWSKFRLDKDFHTPFEGYQKGQDIIREIIYDKYPDSPSISLGSLPPIVSPMFWETVSGMNREDIHSFKFKGEPISEESYERNLQMYNYQRKTIKIYLVNPSAYVESIIIGFKKSNFTIDEQINLLQRRSNALNIMRDSIEQRNWPRFLLFVPIKPVKDKDISFTVTPHMEIVLHRNEGVGKHHGHFLYYCQQNRQSKRIWMKRWHQARIHYANNRHDFPDDLLAPENINLMEDECRHFNINSVNILQSILEGLLLKYDSQKKTKNYSDFLLKEMKTSEIFYEQVDNVLDSIKENNISVQIYFQKIKAKEINMGDKFKNISGSTIINRSNLTNSLNKIKENHGEVVADAIKEIGKIIEKSGNDEAAELFNAFNNESSKDSPSKPLLKSFWNGITSTLPVIEKSVRLIEKISSLF